jgi:hypothetical protein
MTGHKATPEQRDAGRYDWALADTEALDGDPAFRCIMELRARVEALEAAQRAIASSSSDRTHLGLTQDAPASSDSLVEQLAIVCAMPAKWTWDDQARAAIHTIANWLDQQELHGAATRLRMEVG